MFSEKLKIGDYLYGIEDGNITESKVIDIDDKYYYMENGPKVNIKTRRREKFEKDKIKLDKIKSVIKNLSYDDLSFMQIHKLYVAIDIILKGSK